MQHLLSYMRRAMEDYNMILPGDTIAVGVSGGKDSLALLCALANMRQWYPNSFQLKAITLDPQFDGVPGDYSAVEALCNKLDVPYRVEPTDIGEVVFRIRKEKNPCALCAKFRRGTLHRAAKDMGCNKVALGHHREDVTETFLMNLFYHGSATCFQPVTYLTERDITVIRPMIYAPEKEILRVSQRLELPVVKSNCPVNGETERERTKERIAALEKEYPNLQEHILSALKRGNISEW